MSTISAALDMIFGNPSPRILPDPADEGPPRRTVVDSCREMEAQMTPAQRDLAFAIMRANGWKFGDMPPAWVWADVFRMVLRNNVSPAVSTHTKDQGPTR